MVKQQFSTRLSEEALRLLKLLADKNGTTPTAILEQAIRELARKEQIT